MGYKTQKLTVVIFVYWFLLLYMLAALAWWYIALEKQNAVITAIKKSEVNIADVQYSNKIKVIELAASRKTAQYVGEGLTFLALILIGAIYVFRATRRQINLAKQQQNFMMAITHELKTPIAVTQLNLQTLQKRKLAEEQQQKLISNTLQEADRLNSLCNNILFASQLDAGKYATSMEAVNMTELLVNAVTESKSRYSGSIFIEQLAPDITINGDAFLLQLLVSNLLGNAIKYAPKEKPIRVVLSNTPSFVKVEVIDEGNGIAEKEKKKIFEKFYRIGDENTRRTQGSGLGLYLCKKICDYHQATITVTDHLPQGSNFTLLFKSPDDRK